MLCARISYLQAQETQLDKCIAYFDEIILIQNQRAILELAFGEVALQYEAGELTEKELYNLKHAWHTLDKDLDQKASKIYEVAYTEKCIRMDNESKRTQSRDAP